ncbi:MAG: LURP-one-related family protein [Anaerolineales bacterium]
MRRRQKQDFTRYKMREKLVSIGDDFWIEDEDGNRVFKVDGKAMRVRDTLVIEDRQGNPLCKTQERKLRVKDTMEIESPDGDNLATVKKAIISPIRDRFSVKVASGPDLDIKGNILDHEYEIKAGRDNVAEVSKKWFRVRDTYGVEIAPGQNDALILAITTALDTMTSSD